MVENVAANGPQNRSPDQTLTPGPYHNDVTRFLDSDGHNLFSRAFFRCLEERLVLGLKKQVN